MICAIAAGFKLQIKLSSKDEKLPKWLIDELIIKYPELTDRINYTTERLQNFDAVIATGSNNSSRYFEYYFSKYPHIIRKNRNSIAVLSGEETIEQLQKLADDVFLYFGLGCRNISKIFIPETYNFSLLKEAFAKYQHLYYHNKYANNYEYFQTIFAMEQISINDFGYLLIRENESLHSPPAVLHYEKYVNINTAINWINLNQNGLQCVVSETEIPSCIPFGESQKPKLSDYADNVDTMNFLISIHHDN
jgi:hypothetical protein